MNLFIDTIYSIYGEFVSVINTQDPVVLQHIKGGGWVGYHSQLTQAATHVLVTVALSSTKD